MDKQANCLDILINSCKKVVAPLTTGTGRVGLNFYRNKNDSVLILIGSLNKEAEYGHLNALDVISKEKLFLRFFTGCVGPSTTDHMLKSFDEYYDESISGDISAFLQSLEASKIIICYTEPMGGSKAALVILYKICQQINIDCIPIIIKPGFYYGIGYQRDFKDLLGYFETSTYHVYDEDIDLYKQRSEATLEDLNNAREIGILKIADSIMKLI